MSLRIGTSGWNYKHWRGVFYPEDLPQNRWFEFYSQRFDTVEINNSFYRQPSAKTWTQWYKQAPGGFLYAVKAHRYLTHMRKLKDPADPLRRVLNTARKLKEHLGPILYQLPPGWKKNIARLDEFCRCLPGKLTHAIEFRNRDWLADDTFEVLCVHRVCLCIHDHLADHPWQVTGPALYVRFHGQVPEGNYSTPDLRRWARRIRHHADDRPVYAYFNNDLGGHAVANAQSLKRLLHVR